MFLSQCHYQHRHPSFWLYCISLSLSPPPPPRAHLPVVGMLGFLSFDTNQPSLPTPFYSALGVYFCLYGPFNCISFHKFSRQLSVSSFSSGLISALSVFSTVYLFMKVSLSPDIILCGWLGLNHQLTNSLTASLSLPLSLWLLSLMSSFYCYTSSNQTGCPQPLFRITGFVSEEKGSYLLSARQNASKRK